MPSKADTTIARTIGIDTGKNTLHVIGLDEKGAIVLREKVARTRISARFVNVPPCLIGIEAGMASHHVARELVALGHEVKQVPPAYSRPFRQGHKNDFRGRARGCGSCRTPIDAVRSDKDRRATGFAGATSRAVSPDRQSDGCHQSDSRLFIGTRHPGPAGASLSTTAAATASGRTHRCSIAPNDQDHRGPNG